MAEFEQKINYPALLLMQINDIRMAVQTGLTGEIQLENLYMLIATPLKSELEKEIEKINKERDDELEEKLISWMVPIGHKSNKKFQVSMTPEHQTQIIKIRAKATQRIVNSIIDMLYKKELLLTEATTMPSGLV